MPTAQDLNAGMLIVLNDTLCRVTEVTTVRQGKHGQAKYNVAAKSVRTGDDVGPELAAGTKEYAPGSVEEARYQIFGVDDEGKLSLMTEDGEEESVTVDDEELLATIRPKMEAGDDVFCILCTCVVDGAQLGDKFVKGISE